MIDIKLMSAAEISAEIGRRLKGRRLALRITQQELAERASLSVGTVKNLEAKTGACTFDTIIRIAGVLGLAEQFEALFVVRPTSVAQMEQVATAPRIRARRSRHQQALQRLAGKYIWWKTPDEAVAMPARVVAQVMNIGDYDDVQALAHQVGDQYLRDVLVHAEIGMFNERSWVYWHYRLGLAAPGQVPPMPNRRLG